MSGLKTSACRGCGKPIIWAVTEEGKKIPLDPRPPVYLMQIVLKDDIATGVNAVRDERYAVSHFATCPDANRFSKSGGYQPSGDKSAPLPDAPADGSGAIRSAS